MLVKPIAMVPHYPYLCRYTLFLVFPSTPPHATHPWCTQQQVNTSGEESKSGVEPQAVVPLVRHVLGCKYLKFGGLMTIGMPDYTSRPENFEV